MLFMPVSSVGDPSRATTDAHHCFVEGLRFLHSLGRYANQAFGTTTAFRRGISHPGFQQAFLFQPLDRRVERSEGARAAGGFFNLFADRDAVGAVAESRGGRDQQVFEFAEHIIITLWY